MPDDRDCKPASPTRQFLSDLTARYDWAKSYSSNAVLEHNDALSTSELSSVSASKMTLEAEYSRIRSEIASLIATTLLLQKRATLIQSIMDQHIGAVSSLRRFPNEILLEVFEQYVALNPEPYHVFRTDRGPWKLRQVCRKWRQLASSWPRLWSRFAFWTQDVHRRNGFFPSHRFDLLRTAILLSAPRPLSIKMIIQKDYEYCTEDTTNDVLGILKGVSDRWSSLHAEWCSGAYNTVTDWRQTFEHGKVPLLKRLTMKIHPEQVSTDYHPKPIIAFASAPCLTSVSIILQPTWDIHDRSPPSDSNFDFISLPYQQLLDYHCSEVYDRPKTPFIRRAFVDMLDTAAVPKLRVFSYTLDAENVLSGTAMPERSSAGRIVHRGIVKLGVCHPDILERYAFPALADLSVGQESYQNYQYPLETLSLVHSMLLVSGTALTTLRLFGVVLDDYFLSIARLSVNLEVLEVSIFSWFPFPGQNTVLQSFFQELSEESSSRFNLLPILRRLRITMTLDRNDNWAPDGGSVPSEFGFVNATLVQVLKLRRRHRSLDFALTLDGDTTDTWPWLKGAVPDLCESGLVQRHNDDEYSEGKEFLDELDCEEWYSKYEPHCYHPEPEPCADCARRKEDEEFWRAGVA